MTKAELLEKVSKDAKEVTISKKALEELIDSTFEEIKKAIKKNGKFSYPRFGTFSLKHRKARKGRNPRTNEPINIRASKTVGFRPTPSLKAQL